MASNRELARFSVTGRILLSGDGKRVAFQKTGERRLRLWDILANRELASLESPAWPAGRKSFSPDGRVLALAAPGQINLWEADTGKHLGSLALSNATAIAFSPDGQLIAVAATKTGEADPSTTLWKLSTLTEVDRLAGPANVVTFSPDGRTLAVIQTNKVRLWDLISHEVRALTDPSVPDAGSIYGTRTPNGFSPDGRLFAAADNMHVQVWSALTGELLGPLAGPREITTGLAWSPDGKTLATVSGPKVKLWNVANREELTTLLSSNRVGCYAFAPDGSLVVGDQMNKVRIWRTGLDQNLR